MKKGVVFSLDAGFAVFVFLLMLSASIFYISGTERFVLDKLQIERNFEDSLAVMDNLGKLSGSTDVEINNTLFNLTHHRYVFNFILSEYSLEPDFKILNESLINNSKIPNKFVYANKYFFVDENIEKFYELKYWVWEK